VPLPQPTQQLITDTAGIEFFFADVTGLISISKKNYLTTYDWKLLFAGLLVIFGGIIIAYRLDRKIRSEINKLRK
jgi:hypothetical protein